VGVNNFNWRPMSAAPRDGSEIVNLRVITHVGGWSRPISIAPELYLLEWYRFRPEESHGYWTLARPGAPGRYSAHVNENIEWWTTLAEYERAANTLPLWTRACEEYNFFKHTAIAFVRPTKCTWRIEPNRSVLDARVVWNGTSRDDSWECVTRIGPQEYLPVDFLHHSQGSGAGAYGWCHLADFFPTGVFANMLESARRVHEYELERIARLSTITSKRG
jgi:hypothetical protein